MVNRIAQPLVGDRLDEAELLVPIERVNGQSDCPEERGDGRQDAVLVEVEGGDSLAHPMALTHGSRRTTVMVKFK